MTASVDYLHLEPGAALPSGDFPAPYLAVVIIESDVSGEWRKAASDWLVHTGCLAMMAWGRECSAWDDSVDIANLEQFDFGEIPEERSVMTTWHDKDPLEDVFWNAKHTFSHHLETGGQFRHVLLLHISAASDREKMLAAFHEA